MSAKFFSGTELFMYECMMQQTPNISRYGKDEKKMKTQYIGCLKEFMREHGYGEVVKRVLKILDKFLFDEFIFLSEEHRDLFWRMYKRWLKNNAKKDFGKMAVIYLSGNTEVKPQDLLILKNYFWNEPSQIPTVGNILTNICENPIGAKTAELVEMARESFSELSDFANGKDRTDADTELKIIKLYSKSVKELIRIYAELSELKNEDLSEADCKAVEKASKELDELNSLADDIAKTTHIPLAEKMRLNV